MSEYRVQGLEWKSVSRAGDQRLCAIFLEDPWGQPRRLPLEAASALARAMARSSRLAGRVVDARGEGVGPCYLWRRGEVVERAAEHWPQGRTREPAQPRAVGPARAGRSDWR